MWIFKAAQVEMNHWVGDGNETMSHFMQVIHKWYVNHTFKKWGAE